MEEIFQVIKAVNRLTDYVIKLSEKIDMLMKSPVQQLSAKFVDETAACKILRVRPRVLAQMRANKEIPFIKVRRRILFLASDLEDYLKNKCRH